MKTLHIVIGQTGQYEDQRQWLVAAHACPEQASRHREAARTWAEKLENAHGAFCVFGVEALKGRNPFDANYDPSSVMDTEYRVEAVPFWAELPREFERALAAAQSYRLREASPSDIRAAAEQVRGNPARYDRREEKALAMLALLALDCDPEAELEETAAWKRVLAQVSPPCPVSDAVAENKKGWNAVWGAQKDLAD